MIRTIRCFLVAASLLVVIPPASWSAEPAAIVEEIVAGPAGLQPMDFVSPGRILDLGRSGRLVLGYLASCERETIVGGVVTVGATRSTVAGGKVTRERVECDSGQLNLSAEQAGKSGVLVMRKVPGSNRHHMALPALRIFSTSPVVTLSFRAERLSIERVDKPAKAIVVDKPGARVDLAAKGISLVPGATYAAKAGGRSVVFEVSAFARSRTGPMIGRLIRL